MELENVMDELYEQRKYAIDPECTWTIRNEAWVAIDALLDRYNQLRDVGNSENPHI